MGRGEGRALVRPGRSARRNLTATIGEEVRDGALVYMI